MTNIQSWWPTLIETALLGTERRTPDFDGLPAELRPPDAGLSAEKCCFEQLHWPEIIFAPGPSPCLSRCLICRFARPETQPLCAKRGHENTGRSSGRANTQPPIAGVMASEM